MGLTCSSEPAIEPVSLAEAKTHLGVVAADHDAMIGAYVKGARQHFEAINNRAYITSIWQWKRERFPVDPSILYVPRPPLQSVTSIQYVDTAGDTQTWSSGSYDVDTDGQPGRIVPVYGETWPTVRGDLNGITVTFVAGYGTASIDVPPAIRALIKSFVAAMYEAPDGVSGRPLTENPVMQRLERADSMMGVV